MFKPQTIIWLDHTEKELRKLISEGETPFLGLNVGFFKQSWKDYISKNLQTTKYEYKLFLEMLFKWPAISATYLTLFIVEGYGTRGNHEVYPFIDKAISDGNKRISSSDKESLWTVFRRACLSLGLDTQLRKSGTNYMVDEYLKQCGIPLEYIPELTDRMLRYGSVAGFPEDDDPISVRLWQDGLIQRLGNISVTVKKTLASDENGYYIRLFSRLMSDDYTLSKDALRTEQIMFHAIENADNKLKISARSQVMLVPRVVWRDDVLGLELPPGETVIWTISHGDESFDVGGHLETQFSAFDTEQLPKEVIIKNNQNDIKYSHKLWEEGKANRFLIFDENGYFVTNGGLATEKSICIDPGEYVFVSRFKSKHKENECYEVSQDPNIYQWQEILLPDEEIELQRGPAKCVIQSLSRPLIKVEGESIQDIKGKEVFLSHELLLKIIISKELVEITEQGFVAKIKSQGIKDDIEIDVNPDDNGVFTLNFEQVLQQWDLRLDYILVELKQKGINRSIVRKRLLVWNGLENVKDRIAFFCSKVPDNIDRDSCENLDIDDSNSKIKFRDDSKRTFRMIFKLSEKRNLTLIWSVPGIFLHVEDFSSDQVIESPIKKGITRSIKNDSREVLEIRTTFDGVLSLGEYRQVIKKKIGKKRIHFSSLVEYLTPDADTLSFLEEGTATEQPLIKLVTPHEVLEYSSENKNDSHHVKFSLTSQTEEIRCKVVELFSGSKDSFEIKCNDPQALLNPETKASAFCLTTTEAYVYELQFNFDKFHQGAWIINFEVKINGRWGILSNSRDDVFSSGFILNHLEQQGSSIFLNRLFDMVPDEERMLVFERFHKALLVCYALESWPTLKWISDFWQQLIHTFDYQSEKELGALIILSLLSPPETSSPSWFPLLSIGASVPEIYAQPCNLYKKLSKQFTVFSVFHQIKKPYVNLFQDNLITISVAGGFKNFIKIVQGKEPSQFDLKQYKETLMIRDLPERWSLLSSEDWIPGNGDYLGSLHYRFAIDSLKSKYSDSLLGNEIRRGYALRLANRLQNSVLENFAPGIPEHLYEAEELGLFSPEPEEGWNQEAENLHEIIHFLSIYAAVCRWETRIPGTLENFNKKINDILKIEPYLIQQAVGYLLYVGADIFYFYLLLWEVIFKIDVQS